jgi:predicted glycogen debranching enzyme
MSALDHGRERLGDLDLAARLEWLITNGIGGYAAGTVGGPATRRYHGLLVAALAPPARRTLLLAGLTERLELDGAWTDLHTTRWRSGATHPRGHLHLESFRLEDTIPAWTWALGDVRLEKRIWMESGENTTLVEYRLVSGHGPVQLDLGALVNHRDHHGLGRAAGEPRLEPAAAGLRVEMFAGATPLWLTGPGAVMRPACVWHRDFALERERERGLEDAEDHWLAASFAVRLQPGESFTLVASTRREAGMGGPLALAAARARRIAHERDLVRAWERAAQGAARKAPDWVRALVLGADAFLVEAAASAAHARTLLAGYPWHEERGRDALIALPGLALATGRPELMRALLMSWAVHEERGLLPDAFPEDAPPRYPSPEAALWLFHAVNLYDESVRDDGLLERLYPVLENIGAWFERGTGAGIAIDPRDGLLRAGDGEDAPTWMDARAGAMPVTPRRGKAVEINALWYNALVAMARLARRLGRAPDTYQHMARRAAHSFDRFWNQEAGCLYDVIDGPQGPDDTIRPNQILAVSLAESPLPAPRRRAVVECCGRLLLTSHGLRTLAPAHPSYRGAYVGDAAARELALHQGTAWPWLLPHYALAHLRVHRDRAAALALLEPLGRLAGAMGLGFLPELADGDPPHRPRGGFAHAAAVGETLRVWHALNAAKTAPARRRATAAIGGQAS